MQQQHISQQFQRQHRLFTASDLAEYEYCPLVWWYQQYDPLAEADTEELFARMVEIEHTNGPSATALPEYQVIEQLLLRRGAFARGQEQHQEHAEAIAELDGMRDAEEEHRPVHGTVNDDTRLLMKHVIWALLIVALIALVAAFLLSTH